MNIDDIMNNKPVDTINKKYDKMLYETDWYPNEGVVTGPFLDARQPSITAEHDPIFMKSPASTITNEDIQNWNNSLDNKDYNVLDNKPAVNDITLVGDKSLEDLNIFKVTNLEIDALF